MIHSKKMVSLTMSTFFISTEQSQFDFPFIHQFIRQSYWAKDIPESVLQKAIENSLCFGVFRDNGKQVGFARTITDKATFAYLADVFIIPEFRGLGLSRQLMQAIIDHPDLQGLRRWLLATRDAHGLYAKFEFTPLTHPDTFMQLWTPNIYQNKIQAIQEP